MRCVPRRLPRCRRGCPPSSPTSRRWCAASHRHPFLMPWPRARTWWRRSGERHLGTAPERIALDGCPHLRWRFGDGRAAGPGARASRHRVAPRVTGDAPVRRRRRGAARPWVLRHEGGAGARAARARRALARPDGVTLLVTGDEELGSPSSRELIEAEAAGCRAALVLEASADGGRAQDRPQGRVAVRGAGRRTGGARRARAGARGQRDRRARAPGAARSPGSRDAGARHHRDADGAVVGDGGERRARRRRRSRWTCGCGTPPSRRASTRR